jgi:iron complex outermembrane receptor protein
MNTHIFALSLFLILNLLISAQSNDSVRAYTLNEITVFGKKYSVSQSEFPVEKDNLSSVLELGGFNIIRKGVFLAQDIYADGLKRGDYTLVVDGERCQNACPMRMDAPISRINPIEVESLELVKSSSNLQAGLGGVVAINRSIPKAALDFSGSLTQLFGKSNETDFAVAAEKLENRISLRYTRGTPYKTGDNKTFKDLYGYKNNSEYKFGEASLFGVASDWKYNGSIMYSEDISFPYLQMDERKSVVYSGSLSYQDYKIYLNYTDHLMDNQLRVSSMLMETDAKNLTVGVKSEFLDAFYRHWNADNKIMMMNNPMGIYNNILPQVNQYSANIFHKTNFGGFEVSGKIGLSYFNIGNKDILSFYNSIHEGAKDYRFFLPAGASISRSFLLADDLSLSGMLDIASEAPEAEALYVNVKRMMGKPYWSGNPNLKQPIRSTLRTNFSFTNFNADLFCSYIYNYVYLTSANAGMQKYQTYGNINSLIAGLSLSMKLDFIESNLSYTYGENLSSNSPLVEIVPLHISTKVMFPEILNLKFYLKHSYENAQKRIDEMLNETTSSAWNKIDLGMTYEFEPLLLSIDAENILNFNYSKHLSYTRDPFASGFRIIEPGLSYRINLRYYY